jgi:RNA polymerase sigma-70 factor (ECF subfamily)
MATTSRSTSSKSPAASLAPEATVELLNQIKGGDGAAMERLLQRCMPALRRWAHGRLPPSSRGMLETADLVQDAVVAGLRRLDAFESRHQGALQAYFRQAVMNRIRDLVRQQKRRPEQTELPEHLVDKAPSPLEHTIGAENVSRYKAAVCRLKPADRQAIIGRVEMQYSYEMLAVVLNKPTASAARVAVTRAMKRLATAMDRAS